MPNTCASRPDCAPLDHARRVVGEVGDRERLVGPAARADTAVVERDHVEVLLQQREELLAPQLVVACHALDQQQRRTRAPPHVVDLPPVDVHMRHTRTLPQADLCPK
jgi:hypothetical protein